MSHKIPYIVNQNVKCAKLVNVSMNNESLLKRHIAFPHNLSIIWTRKISLENRYHSVIEP